MEGRKPVSLELALTPVGHRGSKALLVTFIIVLYGQWGTGSESLIIGLIARTVLSSHKWLWLERFRQLATVLQVISL